METKPFIAQKKNIAPGSQMVIVWKCARSQSPTSGSVLFLYRAYGSKLFGANEWASCFDFKPQVEDRGKRNQEGAEMSTVGK